MITLIGIILCANLANINDAVVAVRSSWLIIATSAKIKRAKMAFTAFVKHAATRKRWPWANMINRIKRKIGSCLWAILIY